MTESPRLRTAEKVPPPYPLGRFPGDVPYKLGERIVYLFATRPNKLDIVGDDFESMFAYAVGAEWAPSNVGLDDIKLGNCAWSAKTVKTSRKQVWDQDRVRLVIARASPVFSYGSIVTTNQPPDEVGEQVLGIWNARVESLRQRHAHTRTVVLIKPKSMRNDPLHFILFEFETVRYDANMFSWVWNRRENLEGYRDGKHWFTWQPHGSQLSLLFDIPDEKVLFEIRKPEILDRQTVLQGLGFNRSWVTIRESQNE